MERSTRLVLLSPLALACGLLGYGAAYCWHWKHIETKTPSSISRLCSLGQRTLTFYQEEGHYPRTPHELRLSAIHLLDPVHGQPFVWWSGEEPQAKELFKLAWQPESYRTRLFPFGEVRQYGLLSDGRVVDLFEPPRDWSQSLGSER